MSGQSFCFFQIEIVDERDRSPLNIFGKTRQIWFGRKLLTNQSGVKPGQLRRAFARMRRVGNEP